MDFPEGWSFPWGTNRLRSAALLACDEVRPLGGDGPVASVGVPLGLVPLEGVLWYGPTPSNTYAFAWRNALAGRDRARPVDARIELFRNGDVAVSTNGVTRRIPRELPFPHDGYGQDADWVRANFTNAEEILSVGYSDWVDARVGTGLANGLYRFEAVFPEDPPEATRLVVGDLSVCVTNAGAYAFVLEKGREYRFRTEPHDGTVRYAVRDDAGAGSTVRAARNAATASPGVWTVGGGERLLALPLPGSPGRCLWMPTLRGSPDLAHLGPGPFPAAFEAVLSDYCGDGTPPFSWWASDPAVRFTAPNARTTRVEGGGIPGWGSLEMSVRADLPGGSLVSHLSTAYGTNETPQVYLSIDAPDAVFVNDDGDEMLGAKDYEVPGRHPNDDDIVPVIVSMHSDVATNGTLVVSPLIRDGHLWKDEGRTSEVALEERIPISGSKKHSCTFYLECESESYGYLSNQIGITWEESEMTSQHLVHNFTSIDCVAEPITSDSVTVEGKEYIVNPCCAIIGESTYMRVRVAPKDIPDERISWRVLEGIASFPHGNTGRDVVVVAGGIEGDIIILEVDVDGGVGRCPRFELLVTRMRDVRVYPYLIVGDVGAELTECQLLDKLTEVNKVYRQVGLRFSSAPIEVIDNYEWSRFGLSKRGICRDIRNYAHKTDGVEVYFIGNGTEMVEYSTKAIGRANSDGIVIRCQAPGRTLVHEIGHVCGLTDIYSDDGCAEQLRPLQKAWMPSDWNNGTGSRFYSPDKCLLDLIPQLLMYGIGSGNHVDIPQGFVRGLLRNRKDPSQEESGNAAVGRSAMIVFPPHTQ